MALKQLSTSFRIGLCFACAVLCSCASPNTQVQRIQGEKDELLATIRQQRDANRNLQTQLASLEQKLDQAETQLAGGTPRPLASRTATPPKPTSYAANTTSKSAPKLASKSPAPAGEEALPWRPHRASTQPPASLPAIAQLARQDDRIEVDAETGAGVWAEGIGFEQNSSVLTPESRQQLAELAKLLQRSPASKFRILVATSAERSGSRTQEGLAKSGRQLATSRAQSVADYLDRHGIAEDRLAISSTGVRKSNRNEHGQPITAAEEVRVYLVDPDQPVLGWLNPEIIRR
ncbi:OmpA family protein [Anatilimnocola aggregata]|uniref:OmpA family protein n=1 Tax=Anatilimnocola aggregata TaxID=2528021 RepID=A0A517YDM4_9BACT|nr:OmpA family protein [Anatilimnocola aggregata]QDU28334.1 OmpA family protein [Anatilimnocola aggregata]